MQKLVDERTEGDDSVLRSIRQGAQRICRNLRDTVFCQGRGLQPNTQAAEIACPICGLYFGSEAGLVMHIKSQHKETHENAKVTHVKSKHSIFGIPMCKFCLKLQCDWQSPEKHITMGGCFAVKAAIASGTSMEELYVQTEQAHALHPPQPPEAIKDRLDHKVLLADGAPIYSALNSELDQYADSIWALKSRCALCGQVLLSGARVKPHWRRSHAQAWAQVSADAISTCKSLASIIRKPCQFCASKAKNSMTHSGQCPALFQAIAGRSLQRMGQQDSAGQDSKAPKPRRSATEAAYKLFDIRQTPLAQAFRKGSGSDTRALKVEEQAERAETALSGKKNSHPSKRTHDLYHKKQATGQLTIRQALGLGRNDEPGPRSLAPIVPWTFNVRLGNPHQLCYVNASVLSLVHTLQGHNSAELAGVIALCGQSAERGCTLILSRQLVVRSICPRWSFGPTQCDASEFVMALLSERSELWFRWEERRVVQGGIEVVDRGGPVFMLQVPRARSWTLTQAFHAWSEVGHPRAVSWSGRVLIVQLGRYVDGRNAVMVPVFDEGGRVRLEEYRVAAVVVHLGPRPTSGHYRALLRDGDRWGYSDDNARATLVDLTAEHRKNAYLLFLVRASQE